MALFFDSGEKDQDDRQLGIPISHTETGKDYESFRERLHHEVLRSQRRKHSFTVMRISVDFPTEGSGSGNVDGILKATVREYDLLCSMESTQFALVFPETDEQFAEGIADRIKGNVAHKAKAETFLLQTDIGIACFPHDGANAEDLLESAEQDLRSQRSRRHH